MSLDTSKLDGLYIEIGLQLDRQQGHGGSFEEKSKHQQLRWLLDEKWPGHWVREDHRHPDYSVPICVVCGETHPT